MYWISGGYIVNEEGRKSNQAVSYAHLVHQCSEVSGVIALCMHWQQQIMALNEGLEHLSVAISFTASVFHTNIIDRQCCVEVTTLEKVT